MQHPILLIGSGRLALHLQHWNSLLDKPNHLLTWDRSQDPHLLQTLLQKSKTVWLAISDSAIISFYEKYLQGFDLSVIHFSGALHDTRLMCAHPTMSFPKNLLADSIYAKIHFQITGFTHLQKYLPGFENEFQILPAEQKALYHALCVMAGNFPQLLWNQIFSEWQKMGLSADAFDIYIQQITINFIQSKNESLTGPFVRKDLNTIEKNLISLSNTPVLKNIYQTFSQELLK